MNWALVGFTNRVMIVVALYVTSTTLVFLPIVAPFVSPKGVFFLSIFVASVLSIALGFGRFERSACMLAVAVGFAASTYWWIVISQASRPIWSDFRLFVAPEICFSIAGFARWILRRPHSEN